MSSCETFRLPTLELDCGSVREVLRCILHTILFNRVLGHVRLVEVDSDLLNISYVSADDREVTASVESGIHEFCAAVERKSTSGAAQVRLAFFERRQKASWFGSTDERVFWEQWLIPLQFIGHADELHRSVFLGDNDTSNKGSLSDTAGASLGSQVQQAMSYITRCCGERRDHLPPVTSSAVVTYPYDISVTASDINKQGFSLGQVKKLLLQTSPPPMIS